MGIKSISEMNKQELEEGLKEIETQLKAYEDAKKDAEKANNKNKVSVIEAEMKGLNDRKKIMEDALTSIKNDSDKNLRKAEAQKKERTTMKENIEKAEKHLETSKKKLEEATKKLEEKKKEKQKELDAAAVSGASMSDIEDKYKTDIEDLEKEKADAEKEVKSREAAITRFNSKITKINEDLKGSKEDRRKESLEKMKEELKENDEKISKSKKEMVELRLKINEAKKDRDKAVASAKDEAEKLKAIKDHNEIISNLTTQLSYEKEKIADYERAKQFTERKIQNYESHFESKDKLTEYEKSVDTLKNDLLGIVGDLADEDKENVNKLFDSIKGKYDESFAENERTTGNQTYFAKAKAYLEQLLDGVDEDKKSEYMKKYDEFVDKYYGKEIDQFSKDFEAIKKEFATLTGEDLEAPRNKYASIFEMIKSQEKSDKMDKDSKEQFDKWKAIFEEKLEECPDEGKVDEFLKKYDAFIEEYYGKSEPEKDPEKDPDEEPERKESGRDYSTATAADSWRNIPSICSRYLDSVYRVNLMDAFEKVNGLDEDASIADLRNVVKEKLEDESLEYKSPKGLKAKFHEWNLKRKAKKNLKGKKITIKGAEGEKNIKAKMAEMIAEDILSVKKGNEPITGFVKNLAKQNRKVALKESKRYSKLESKDDKIELLKKYKSFVERDIANGRTEFVSHYDWEEKYIDKDGNTKMVTDSEGEDLKIGLDQVIEALDKQIELVNEYEYEEPTIDDDEPEI